MKNLPKPKKATKKPKIKEPVEDGFVPIASIIQPVVTLPPEPEPFDYEAWAKRKPAFSMKPTQKEWGEKIYPWLNELP